MLIPASPSIRLVKPQGGLLEQSTDPSRVAVLLNRNARRVTDALAKRIERLVGKDNLFYSRSLDEAESFAREIVQRGFGTVVCGGGDGTLIRAVNLIQHYIDEANSWRMEHYRRLGEAQKLLTAPRYAVLRLGTGNGLHPVVGNSNPEDDVRSLVDYAPGREHSLRMISCENERFLFGGLGYDSMLLNDYNGFKKHTKSALLRPFMHSVGGYFAAFFARTLPRILTMPNTSLEMRVVTKGPAHYIDPRRGDAAQEIPAGSVLYEGPANMVGAGTTPFYGYGLKMYPFASIRPDVMQLRIARIGALKALTRLPSLWGGTYRNFNDLMDFFVTDVEIQLEKPFPFQHSGDDQGARTHLRWQLAEQPLRLVDFYRPSTYR
jgi:hypothetical protein